MHSHETNPDPTYDWRVDHAHYSQACAPLEKHMQTQPHPNPQSLKDQLKAAREELLDAKGQLEILERARAALETREAAHEAERKEAAARGKEEREEADKLRKALEVGSWGRAAGSGVCGGWVGCAVG